MTKFMTYFLVTPSVTVLAGTVGALTYMFGSEVVKVFQPPAQAESPARLSSSPADLSSGSARSPGTLGSARAGGMGNSALADAPQALAAPAQAAPSPPAAPSRAAAQRPKSGAGGRGTAGNSLPVRPQIMTFQQMPDSAPSVQFPIAMNSTPMQRSRPSFIDVSQSSIEPPATPVPSEFSKAVSVGPSVVTTVTTEPTAETVEETALTTETLTSTTIVIPIVSGAGGP